MLNDYELNENIACLVYADIKFNNGTKAIINAWVIVEDKMTFTNGDFRIASENCDIDHDALRPQEKSFVSDCLDTLEEIEEWEISII